MDLITFKAFALYNVFKVKTSTFCKILRNFKCFSQKPITFVYFHKSVVLKLKICYYGRAKSPNTIIIPPAGNT